MFYFNFAHIFSVTNPFPFILHVNLGVGVSLETRSDPTIGLATTRIARASELQEI